MSTNPDPRPDRISARMARIPADLWLFAAMMIALAVGRIAHTAQVRSMYVDGGLYLEVAKHVRDGHGLVTNLSLYHSGYERFPHPTSLYPLWPWILGMGGRLVDIDLLAHWLPVTLSLAAVFAAFLFGRRLWPEPMFPDDLPGLHAGHVFALGLAVQHEFLWYSVLPYTEPLAWLLVFGLLWRVVQKGPDLGWGWAVEIGVWLSLLYLVRFQLMVALMAMAAAYAIRIALGPQRGRLLAHATVALGIPVAVMAAWFLHIRTFVADAGLGSLLRFDQNRSNHLLSEIDIIVDTPGPLWLLLDRASGIPVAWDPASGSSYTGSYYAMHWALAAAIPFAVVAVVQTLRRDGWAPVRDRLRRPEGAHWFFVLLFATGALLSVHAIHKHYNGSWYFGSRQGLTSLPAFLLPMAWLLRHEKRLARLFGIVVLSTVAMVGTQRVWDYGTVAPTVQREGDRFDELIPWLEKHKGPDGRLIVAVDSAQVQRLAWQTEDIGYHWIQAATPYTDIVAMTDRLGARYVIVRKRALDRTWKLFGDWNRLRRDFVQLKEMPDGHVIFERRRTPGGP